MKYVTLSLAAILATAGLSTPQPVEAGSLSCGNYRFTGSSRSPTTKYEILKKCGEPTYREGDTWVYDRSGKSVLVHFKAGQVTSIRWEN